MEKLEEPLRNFSFKLVFQLAESEDVDQALFLCVFGFFRILESSESPPYVLRHC